MSNPFAPVDLRYLAAGQEQGRQNALRGFLQQNGGALMSGDAGAINALAAMDPRLAMQMQGQQDDRAFRREQVDYQRGRDARADSRADERLEMARAQFAQATEQHIATMDGLEVKQEAARLQPLMQQAATALQIGDLDAFNAATGQMDESTPLVNDMDDARILFSGLDGAFEVMNTAQDLFGQEAPRPMSPPGKVQADIDAGFLSADTPLRSAGVTVNTGSPYPGLSKLGEGFTYLYDENGNILRDEMGRPMSAPIPGSKAAAAAEDRVGEQESASRASDLAFQDYERKFNIVDESIDKALGMLDESGRWVAGVGSLLSGLPETPARDFQAVVDTVKANLGFEELQAMRDSSPTGGALGQVTEREIAFLQAIQGNLDTAQSPEQLAQVLQQIKARRAEFRQERLRIMGRSEQQPAAEAYSTFDEFSTNPGAKAAADAANVTLEEMWQILQEGRQ